MGFVPLNVRIIDNQQQLTIDKLIGKQNESLLFVETRPLYILIMPNSSMYTWTYPSLELIFTLLSHIIKLLM